MNKDKHELQQLHQFLKYVYGIVPIVAGLDKFSNLLTDWKNYLSQFFTDILPFDAELFMLVIGMIEVAAGITVLVKPRVGGIVVMSWLIIIAVLLIFNGAHFDVAVRDLVMAAGAFALIKLTNILTSIEMSRQIRVKG